MREQRSPVEQSRLYHGAEKKVYTLDPALKTYYIQSFDEISEASPGVSQSPSVTMKVDGDINLAAGSETRTVSGNTAKVFW